MNLEIQILVLVRFLQHPISNTLHPGPPLPLCKGPSAWTLWRDAANHSLPNWFSPSLLQSSEV